MTEESAMNPERQESPDAGIKQPKAGKPKRKLSKKTLAVLGIVVVLIGAGGVGFFFWHEQPTFCNAICHTPMDPYVESYENNVSIRSYETQANVRLSVTAHKESDQDIRCLTCHPATISQQIEEAYKWVTGDYEVPLPLMKYDGVELCLTPECHEGVASQEDLKSLLSDQIRNPHQSHMGDIECSQCHRTHEQSIMLCTQCHADAPVPDGWLTYAEYNKLVKGEN
jgi:hypothetical protein